MILQKLKEKIVLQKDKRKILQKTLCKNQKEKKKSW